MHVNPKLLIRFNGQHFNLELFRLRGENYNTYITFLSLHRYMYFKSNASDDKQSWMVMGIIFSIFWLVLLCVVIFLHRKIQLVIQILKEATKAAIAMPLLIFTPVLVSMKNLLEL